MIGTLCAQCLKLRQNRFMVQSMIIRSLRERYVGSFLGVFWSVIHPLAQMLLYFFVFGVVLKLGAGPEFGDTHFAIWMIAGLLPWLFLSDVVVQSPGVIVAQANLVTKIVFPSEMLPLVHVVAAFVNHLVALGVFLLIMFLTGGTVSVQVFWVFPILFAMSMLTLGMSLILSTLNVFVRDVGEVVGVGVQIWFFLTPIIYPYHLVPECLHWVYQLNPSFHMVEGYRAALLGMEPISLGSMTYLLTCSLLMLGVGSAVFIKLKPSFADVL